MVVGGDAIEARAGGGQWRKDRATFVLLKLSGPVEAWYQDLGENPPIAKV